MNFTARGSITLFMGLTKLLERQREQTEKLFRKFLNEALKIPDPNAIALADIH